MKRLKGMKRYVSTQLIVRTFAKRWWVLEMDPPVKAIERGTAGRGNRYDGYVHQCNESMSGHGRTTKLMASILTVCPEDTLLNNNPARWGNILTILFDIN